MFDKLNTAIIKTAAFGSARAPTPAHRAALDRGPQHLLATHTSDGFIDIMNADKHLGVLGGRHTLLGLLADYDLTA